MVQGSRMSYPGGEFQKLFERNRRLEAIRNAVFAESISNFHAPR